jgi:hypothetical protein
LALAVQEELLQVMQVVVGILFYLLPLLPQQLEILLQSVAVAVKDITLMVVLVVLVAVLVDGKLVLNMVAQEYQDRVMLVASMQMQTIVLVAEAAVLEL